MAVFEVGITVTEFRRVTVEADDRAQAIRRAKAGPAQWKKTTCPLTTSIRVTGGCYRLVTSADLRKLKRVTR